MTPPARKKLSDAAKRRRKRASLPAPPPPARAKPAKPGTRSKPRSAPEAGALATYQSMRDFGATPEPRGGPVRSRKGGARKLRFVVQQHDATRMHWDFRLEIEGVLVSWAVPKGPSLDPGQRRLAVQTEDHPIEYGTFEGVIPAGHYGAGAVLLWDRGWWLPEGDPAAGLRKGRLTFALLGEKLRGTFSLVRMGDAPPGPKSNWLLFKRSDEYARPGSDVIAEQSRSVDTGRDLAEIEAAWRD
jgi:bifunctional non-homologous end joining protein LigD